MSTSPIVFLKGRKVSLRPLDKEDLPMLTRWINDPDIRDFVKAFWPMTLADEEKWFESLGSRKPNDLLLGMVNEEGTLIGNMAIHNIDWRSRIGTTGALIGEKDYWGRGYGREAKILLLHHAFDTMNLRKICSQVIAYNVRSRKYSEACGYKVEGTLREHVFRRGQYWDLINLAVFREDFEPVWARYLAEVPVATSSTPTT